MTKKTMPPRLLDASPFVAEGARANGAAAVQVTDRSTSITALAKASGAS